MTRLNLLLIGKTGSGKSATGNSILGRRAFKTSSGVMSVTTEVVSEFTETHGFIIKVVDGPGFGFYVYKMGYDRQTDDFVKALSLCDRGVDAFLFVVRYGSRFTSEDVEMLKCMEEIFGNGFLQQVIVVMTCGDLFGYDMEDTKMDFPEWCREQEGCFRDLIEKCDRRIVLFNNNEKDELKRLSQVKQLIDLVDTLHKKQGRYTSDSFQTAADLRERCMLKLGEPILRESLQQTISLLNAEIEHLYNDPSEMRVKKIKERIQDLKDAIIAGETGRHSSEDLRKLVDNMEENLHDVSRLRELSQQLENIRKAKIFYSLMGTTFTLVGGALGLVVPFVGAVVSVASAVSMVAGCMEIGSKEKEMEDKQEEIKQQRLKLQEGFPENKPQEHYMQHKSD